MGAAQRKILILIGTFLAVWLGIRYLLPVILPFLLGSAFALLADPMVRCFENRFRMKRLFAVALGVGLLLTGVLGLLALLGIAAYWELGNLAGQLPGILEAVREGWNTLAQWLLELAGKAPAAVGNLLTDWVQRFSTGGTNLLDQISGRLINLAGDMLGILPDGLLFFGTALLSAFMISAKLPQLRRAIRQRTGGQRQEKAFSLLRGLRKALGGWLRAEAKLAGITFLIVTAGLLLLHVPYGALWSSLIALVDAVPMLGTGTILMPWAGLCLLRRDTVRAVGLLAIYLISTLTRSALEPRLVGHQLGLDPLLTLAALYAGFRIWGIGGMLLAPILTVTAVQLCEMRPKDG